VLVKGLGVTAVVHSVGSVPSFVAVSSTVAAVAGVSSAPDVCHIPKPEAATAAIQYIPFIRIVSIRVVMRSANSSVHEVNDRASAAVGDSPENARGPSTMPGTAKILPIVLVASLAFAAGCRAPGATMVGEAVVSEPLTIDVADAELNAADLVVEPLELEGVRGGRMTFALEGTPREVVAMLLDFDSATGHRPWAVDYERLTGEEAQGMPQPVRSRWRFEGKAGIDPTIVLDFTLDDASIPTTLEFHASEPAFGLAAFFGEHRIWPHPERDEAAIMELSIYIDSGLPFVNATAEDLEAGLREDAAMMRAWMRERLGR